MRAYEPWLRHKEETFGAIFVHDTPEDYDVPREELVDLLGDIITDATWLLTKDFRGRRKDDTIYYEDIAESPIASVAKGADRVNNFQTSVEVFTVEKQLHYVEETESKVIPMLKEARRKFPDQEPVYENLKIILMSQMRLIKLLHKERGIG